MKTEAGKVLNMIWANEAGVSIYIYEDEHERRIIEIHGVVNDYEIVLATATIEKHNRDNFAETISTNNMRLSATEAARLADAAATGAATSMRSLCVEKVKAIHEERLKDLRTLIEKGEVEHEDAEYERAVLFVLSNVIDSLKSLTLEAAANESMTNEATLLEADNLLWINPVAGAVAHYKAGAAFLPYRLVREDGDDG